jgi:hypothetical protein
MDNRDSLLRLGERTILDMYYQNVIKVARGSNGGV